jgi:GntR family transcriptional repressor for pyruvate dehydrogenase complex
MGINEARVDERFDRGLSAFRPIRLRKASDEVLAALIDAIRGGLYQPGDLLPRERDLAEQLEVSRTVVRAAIETLREAGVLSVRRGRRGGTQVASTAGLIDVLAKLGGKVISDLRSILEARRVLEVSAALLAARRMSTDDFAELDVLVNDLPHFVGEPESFYEADVRFHLALATRSGSEVIADYLRDVFKRLVQIRAQLPFAHVTFVDAIENQRNLLRAVESRDEARILRAIDEHLSAFERVMLGQPLDFLPIDGASPDS